MSQDAPNAESKDEALQNASRDFLLTWNELPVGQRFTAAVRASLTTEGGTDWLPAYDPGTGRIPSPIVSFVMRILASQLGREPLDGDASLAEGQAVWQLMSEDEKRQLQREIAQMQGGDAL